MIKPLISLIVPVYNGEEGIGPCLESLLSQTYSNIECIVVNDGSADATQAILEEYAARDRRVKPFHIPNGGVSNARNYGKERASGEYLMFVDGDDLLAPETLEKMLEQMGEDTSFVQCGIRSVGTDGAFIRVISQTPPATIGGYEAIMEAFFDKTILSSVCAKLYRASLLKDLWLDPAYAVGEDDWFTYHVCKASKSVVLMSDMFYSYVLNPDSVMQKSFEEKHFQIMEINQKQLAEQKKGTVLYRACAVCYVQHALGLLWKMFDAKAMYHRFSHLRKEALRFKGAVLCSGKFTVKDKLVYLLLWWMPKLYFKLKDKS